MRNILYDKQMKFITDILFGIINVAEYDELHDIRLQLKEVIAQLENKQYRLFREQNEAKRGA